MKNSLIIPVEPIAKERPRLGRNNNIYTPKATRDYEELIGWYATRLPRYEGFVSLNVTFFCSPQRKMPDIDNLIKALLDGLQKGGAIVDDVQVSEINACRMLEHLKPRVELRIVPLDPVRALSEAPGG